MKIVSEILDKRIASRNILVEMNYKEYLGIAKQIKNNNELQRKRVTNAKSVYSLLQKDMEIGCIFPPIVLAITNQKDSSESVTEEELNTTFSSDLNEVLILDGLQRTNTLLDAEKELSSDSEKLEEFYSNKLRVEIYAHINKFGVLYRMLTLNCGQTPMKPRHQIEMLYSDLLHNEIDGVKIIKDTDPSVDKNELFFTFQYAIEGFDSYLKRDELPIDKQELLDNIEMLENMSKEDSNKDVFKDFISLYIKFFKKMISIYKDFEITDDMCQDYGIKGNPFGRNAIKVFSTSQSFTGFGAAIGKLKEMELITGFDSVHESLNQLKNQENSKDAFMRFLLRMDSIKTASKKIGKAQRMFFCYFYRQLFNPSSDTYLDIYQSVENGYKKYYSQVC